MELHIHIHHHGDDKILSELNSINQKLGIMANTQAELAAQLNDITTQLQKVGSETQSLLSKIDDLESAINNQANVSPELQTAFDALKAQAQVVDDLVPDAPASTGTDTNTGDTTQTA